MHQLVVLLVVLFFFGLISPVFAQQVSTRYLDLFIEGGASGGYFYSNTVYDENFRSFTSTLPDFENNPDNIVLSDLLLELRTGPFEVMKSEFRLGVGHLKQITILDGNANHAMSTVYEPVPATTPGANISQYDVERMLSAVTADDFNIYYAFMAFSPIQYARLELGQLATNLGYEVSPTYANWNIGLGLTWMKQPTYYPGLRASYQVGSLDVYAEINQDTSGGGNSATALGLFGQTDKARYSVGFFKVNRGRSVFDAMGEYKLPMVTVAANFNYHLTDITPDTGDDRVAYALAFYAIPHFRQFDFPVRLELIRDGETRIFPYNKAYSLTFTPTMTLADNLYVRGEVSYISSFNQIFKGLSDELIYYRKTSYALQMGYYF